MFRERFNEYAAARLTLEDLAPQLEIDAVLELREIDDRSVAEVLSLAPFGHGNPRAAVRRAGCGSGRSARGDEGEAPARDRCGRTAARWC